MTQRVRCSGEGNETCYGRRITNYKWAQLDSNQRPTSYEPAALTTELWALAECIITYLPPPGKRVIPDFNSANVAVTLTCNSFRDRLSYGYLFPGEFTLHFQFY